MGQKYNAQSPGSTSTELVRLSAWLLACALFLEENSPRVTHKDKSTRHKGGKHTTEPPKTPRLL
jgi:hypothetical protein